MKFALSEEAANGTLQFIVAFIDRAGSPGRIELMTEQATLLSVLRFSFPAAGPAIEGKLAFDKIHEDPSARATGVVTQAHITDGHGELVFECDVSDDRGNAVIRLNSNQIFAGGPVRLESFSLSAP